MKKILSLVLVLATMLGLVVSLSSCGEPKDPGAEISVYLGEGVYDLDPSDYYVSDNAAQLMSLIYEPLFRINKRGKLKCAAADDYEVDEEKREITVTLKESYWSEGTKRVEAKDFVYAWRDIILNPNNANPAAALLYDIENAREVKMGTASLESLGVSTSGVYDLIIKYREGADYEQLLRNLACVATAPAFQDSINLAPDHWSKSTDTITTNGPFLVKTLNYATSEDDVCGVITLERNKGYHQSPSAKDYDDEVNPYRINTKFSVGEKTVNISFKDLEEKTVFYLGDASLKERAEHKDDALVTDLASTYSYIFNTNNPLFKDKNVRYALSLALNRQAIVDAIVFGKAADGLLSEVSRETLGKKREALLSAEADMAKAKSVLATANLNGAAKAFTLTVSASEESLKIAELAKKAWGELGFTVTVNAVDIKTTTVSDKVATSGQVTVYDSWIQYLTKSAALGEVGFDVIGIDLQTYTDDGFVALAAFASSMHVNGLDYSEPAEKDAPDYNTIEYRKVLGGWSSEAYDKLIEEAYKTNDKKVRAAKLIEAEKLLIEEAHIVPVVFNQNFAFVSKELKKVKYDGLGNIFFTEAKLKNYKDYIEEE